jgi:hypothetical protein
MQLYCAYHRWVEGARVLAIDPLDFRGEQLVVYGPSHREQPAPNAPTIRQESLAPGDGWELPEGLFIFEVTVKAARQGRYGVRMTGRRRQWATVLIDATAGELVVRAGRAEQGFPLPRGFRAQADHLFRLEVDGTRCRVMIDNLAAQWRFALPFEPETLGVTDDDAGAEFAAAELTMGWEQGFDGPETTGEGLGWSGDAEGWRVVEGELQSPAAQDTTSMIARSVPGDEYELVVNVRLLSVAPEGGYGLTLGMDRDDRDVMLVLGQGDEGWEMTVGYEAVQETWALPTDFDPRRWQQWRIRLQGGSADVRLGAEPVGRLAVQGTGAFAGVVVSHGQIALDMVRVVALT